MLLSSSFNSIDWNSTATGVIDNGEDIVDVILCPASPGVASPLDCSRYWGYTSQWNLLDYPALVFPVTTVDPALDARDDEYLPKNEQDRYNHDLCKFSISLYTISIETIGKYQYLTAQDDGPERYLGLPVSLQLVGRRYEDEKVWL